MKAEFYRKIINVLLELKKTNPEYNLGKHIATAVDSSSTTKDLWGMSDKELYASIKNYQLAIELDDFNDSELEKILNEGMHLGRILEEDDEY